MIIDKIETNEIVNSERSAGLETAIQPDYLPHQLALELPTIPSKPGLRNKSAAKSSTEKQAAAKVNQTPNKKKTSPYMGQLNRKADRQTPITHAPLVAIEVNLD